MALQAALVTPLQGPLAPYGTVTATALRIWAGDVAGRQLGDVVLSVHDAYPDAAAAMRAAAGSGADVLFGPYGSSTTVAAAGATSRVLWNHGGSTSRLSRARYPHVVNVPAPASTYFEGTLSAVRAADPEAGTVVLLHTETGFASDVAAGAAVAARRLRFEVTDVPLDKGRGEQAARQAPDADVVLMVGGFEEEQAAAAVLRRRPWRAAGLVGAGVEEVLAEAGVMREGLLGPAQWVASVALPPDEGPDAPWFVDRYRHVTGDEPPYPAAQAFAAGVLAGRCVADAGAADEAQLRAAYGLSCRTLYGDFALNPDTGLQAAHAVLTVQWQDGRRRVVWPPAQAETDLAYPLAPPPA